MRVDLSYSNLEEETMSENRDFAATEYIASPHPQNADVWVIYDAVTLMRIDSVNASSGSEAVTKYVDLLQRDGVNR